jgi:hypothetical protein
MLKVKWVKMEIVNLGNQDFGNQDFGNEYDQMEKASLGRGIRINFGGYPYPDCGGQDPTEGGHCALANKLIG